MSYDIFDVVDGKSSVFFVGGTGTKAGLANPGGCTKEWWDAKVISVGEAAAMAALIGTNGGAIDSATTAAISNNGSGKLRITKSGAFTNTEVGMVGYFDFSATYPDDYYEVTAVDASGNYIDILIGYTTSVPTVNVTIGGAFNDIQTAHDEVDAGYQDVTLYDNKGDSNRSATIAWTRGGSEATDAYLRIKGFQTTPEDDGPVLYNYNGNNPVGAGHGLYIGTGAVANMYNTQFENFHVRGVGDGASYTYNLQIYSNTYAIRGLLFYKCDFYDGGDGAGGGKCINAMRYYQASGSEIQALFIDCDFYDGDSSGMTVTSVANQQYGHIGFVNCRAYGNTHVGFSMRGASAFGCASYNNGLYGVDTTNQSGMWVNGIIAGNLDGWKKRGTINQGYLINSIISDNTQSEVEQGSGGALRSINSVINGTIDTGAISNVFPHPTDNVTDDPRLANVAGGDLRIRNTKIKRSGITDIHGNATQLGPPTIEIPSRSGENSLVNQFTT